LILGLSLLAALVLAAAARKRVAIAGLVAYLGLATALRERPLVDPRQATQELLGAWDEGNLWSAGSPPVLASLAIPLELPSSPWVMGRREVGFSRRLDLPPGLYRLTLRGQALLAAKATRDGAARIE